jgi:hypothetical protein
MEDLCFLRGPCRGYKRDEVRNLVELRTSSVRESVKRGLEPEAEE